GPSSIGALVRTPRRHRVVSPAVEAPTSNVLPNHAPLFEEKWNVLLSTCPKNLSNPFDFHQSRAPSRFAADNHPVNIRQIDSSERTDQRLARKKANGG